MLSNVAVIGTGYWGKHYVRILGSQCTVVCDSSPDARNKMKALYPHITTSDSVDSALNDSIQAVVVVTPAATHYAIVKAALNAEKHVLVEKPLTLDVSHAHELYALAKEKQVTLFVGHTFLFNSSVWHLDKIIHDRTKFGELRYISARRTNLGPVRNDTSVLWDLAPHDVSICSALNRGSLPICVSATGTSVLQNSSHVDVAFLTITYDNGTIAHIHVSWCDPHKLREVHAIGSKMRVSFDDMASHPITCFHQSVDVDPQNQERSIFSDGDVVLPQVEKSEPLKNQVVDFLARCRGEEGGASGSPKHMSSRDENIGLIVVKVLSAAEASILQDGAPVKIQHE